MDRVLFKQDGSCTILYIYAQGIGVVTKLENLDDTTLTALWKGNVTLMQGK